MRTPWTTGSAPAFIKMSAASEHNGGLSAGQGHGYGVAAVSGNNRCKESGQFTPAGSSRSRAQAINSSETILDKDEAHVDAGQR